MYQIRTLLRVSKGTSFFHSRPRAKILLEIDSRFFFPTTRSRASSRRYDPQQKGCVIYTRKPPPRNGIIRMCTVPGRLRLLLIPLLCTGSVRGVFVHNKRVVYTQYSRMRLCSHRCYYYSCVLLYSYCTVNAST